VQALRPSRQDCISRRRAARAARCVPASSGHMGCSG
jgi:hypothetical protein